MKIPYDWLKEYIDIKLSPEELAQKLLSIGFEVEEITYAGEGISNVVAGKINNIAPHPDADKLRVCNIDVGRGAYTTIVTGASNVQAGDVVPVALDGAALPGGKTITASPLRGIMSHGMLCSGAELRIDNSVINGAENDGILILDGDTKLGADIKDVLGLNEYILDVSITANRPDCNSIIGIARELCALLNKKLKLPDLNYIPHNETGSALKIKISDSDCSRYIGAAVKDIKIFSSPKWMRDRLRYAGVRPINSIVDITNYVLFETGQPMHAFDCERIEGGEIIVRKAHSYETLRAIDGKDYQLSDKMLVIADRNAPIAIAGVMGGEESGICNSTKEIVFESAAFARASVRSTSRALGLRSASSARFEKGVDAASPEFGLRRALSLVDKLGCGKIMSPYYDVCRAEISPTEITVDINDINKLLGITVPRAKILSILKNLGLPVKAEKNILKITIPKYRQDLENSADIAEEVIRFYGYDKLVNSNLNGSENTRGKKNPLYTSMNKTRATLTGLGAYETLTYSFINPSAFDLLNLAADSPLRNCVKISNPISAELSVMRTTLAHNALTSAALNLKNKNFDFRLFEISRVFEPCEEELPLEHNRLYIAAAGEGEDFYSLKGLVENALSDFGLSVEYRHTSDIPYFHTGRCAEILINGTSAGYLGEVHPAVAENYGFDKRVYYAELDYDKLFSAGKKVYKYAPLPKFQEIQRDIALTVKDEIASGDVTAKISETCGNLLESVELFDIYRGSQISAGFKSIAYALIFRNPEKTLVENEVNSIMSNLTAALQKIFGAELRK